MDLSIISSLVDSTLHSLDDSLLPAANWVVKLLDVCRSLDEEAWIKVTSADIKSFQSNVGNPFVSNLKDNISVHFSSQDIVSSFSIFDPKKIPSSESPRYAVHGEDSIK